MTARYLALALAAFVAARHASPLEAANDPKAQKVYDGIMSDSDIYAGEGVVSLASFGNDINKAKSSGRERARGNMVESIRVRIVSKTTDTQSQGKDGSKESIEAQSSSVADLELENIQYKYLDDFPKEGQLTVLAYLSKEEYQRQSDKRLLAYKPLRSLRISGGVVSSSMENLMSRYSGAPAGALYSGTGGGNVADSQAPVSLGVDFYWYGAFLGAGMTSGRTPVTAIETPPNTYKWADSPWTITQMRLGYEYTPWAKRFQVALPVSLEYEILNWDPYFSSSYGAAAGLSLRYWSTDRVAFDVTGRWHHGLAKADIVDRGGQQVYFRPGEKGVFETTGPEITAGILWNGF